MKMSTVRWKSCVFVVAWIRAAIKSQGVLCFGMFSNRLGGSRTRLCSAGRSSIHYCLCIYIYVCLRFDAEELQRVFAGSGEALGELCGSCSTVDEASEHGRGERKVVHRGRGGKAVSKRRV